MSRKPSRCPGGLAYHIMNRATARSTIFAGEGDYAAFERVLAEAREREAEFVRICSYVLMPNHFHLVLWPRAGEDEAVSRLMKWLTLTHAQRWHAHRHTAGTGALYGARFKSFPVREDWHFLKVCRYVERNPLRANPFDKLRAGSCGASRAMAVVQPQQATGGAQCCRVTSGGGDAGRTSVAGGGRTGGRMARARAT